MEVTIGLGEFASPDALPHLRDWLNDEPALHGRVRAVGPAPEPGVMGATVDQLVVVLGSGGVVSLARALHIWLRQRRSSVEVSLTREDGTQVAIKAEHVKDADVMIRRLLDDPVDDQRPEA